MVVSTCVVVEYERSYKYVAKILLVNCSTVKKVFGDFQQIGENKRIADGGRNREATAIYDIFRHVTTSLDRHLTSVQPKNQLHEVRGTNVQHVDTSSKVRGLCCGSWYPNKWTQIASAAPSCKTAIDKHI